MAEPDPTNVQCQNWDLCPKIKWSKWELTLWVPNIKKAPAGTNPSPKISMLCWEEAGQGIEGGDLPVPRIILKVWKCVFAETHAIAILYIPIVMDPSKN